MYPTDAPEDFADQRMFGRIGMAGSLVGVSNGREAAP
jgi:hypothetical protein